MSQTLLKQIVDPDVRRGGTPLVKKKDATRKTDRSVAVQYIHNLLDGKDRDENLLTLQNKLQQFHLTTDSHMRGMKQAIATGDMDIIAEVARQMTVDTGKVGAIKMMRLCIAMQMLSRRGMVEGATRLFTQLEEEYHQVKEGLIPYSA